MADPTEPKTGQDLNVELRRVLNDAYGFVLGRQATQTFGAVTYEELADQQIARIEGAGTELRPNELTRIDRVEQDLKNLIAQVRDIPPERFLLQNPETDTNTEPEQSEDT
jgi:hypothetical protein